MSCGILWNVLALNKVFPIHDYHNCYYNRMIWHTVYNNNTLAHI